MHAPKITAVVLTYNRPGTLARTLDSILAQDFDDFGVLAMDNCSTDDTPQTIQSYAAKDQRVRHVRNETNIGISRNWNRGLSLNRSPYVCLCHDDDLMLPGFLRETAGILDAHPSVAFVIVQAQFINDGGDVTGVSHTGDVRDGLMSGLDLLELHVDGRGVGLYPPCLMMRGTAVAEVLPLDSPHTRGYVEIDSYFRMAGKHDVYFLRKPLVQYCLHEGSDTELLHREAGATSWYGEVCTGIDAIATLLSSPRAEDPKYRDWLAQRLLDLHKHASAAIHPSAPAMYHPWELRYGDALKQLEKLVPTGDSLILVDDGQFAQPPDWNGRRIIPFLERDGSYFGPPDDSNQAIGELNRLISSGARWIVFAWPSFWWLDRYGQFRHYLDTHFPRRLDTPNLLVFELTG